jgi:hypothetical protein
MPLKSGFANIHIQKPGKNGKRSKCGVAEGCSGDKPAQPCVQPTDRQKQSIL